MEFKKANLSSPFNWVLLNIYMYTGIDHKTYRPMAQLTEL